MFLYVKRPIWWLAIHSLVVISIGPVMAGPEVVVVGVPLLLGLRQPVHQVVRRLVGDVTEDPVHQRLVPLQLMLDGVATRGKVLRMQCLMTFCLL